MTAPVFFAHMNIYAPFESVSLRDFSAKSGYSCEYTNNMQDDRSCRENLLMVDKEVNPLKKIVP